MIMSFFDGDVVVNVLCYKIKANVYNWAHVSNICVSGTLIDCQENKHCHSQ